MSQPPYTKKQAKEGALSRADVERLLHDSSPAARTDIIRKISHLYDINSLSNREIELAQQIFRLLVRDSTLKIRETLAESLKNNMHIPKDIVISLARDVETVATPVLSMSEVLSDQDIVNIVRHTRDVWRYLAISRRPVITDKVSSVLVDTEHQEVIGALLDNRGAAFSAETYDKMVDLAQGSDIIAEKLAARASLPVAVLEKLMNAVSSEVAEKLQKAYRIDREQLDAETHHVLEQNTLELIALRNDRMQTAQLVRQLYNNDRLTASMIINALCHGNLDFFEISIAMLAQVPVENARVLLADKGRLGFRAIYDKSGLPMTMLDAVRLLLIAVRRTIEGGVKPGSGGFASQVINQLMLLANEQPVDNFSYILALIRQNVHEAA